jgi:hypothetical protein
MKIVIAAVLAVSLAGLARAEDKKEAAPASKQSWSAFFKNLKATLSQSAVGGERKRGRSAAAVAAVRGDDQAKKNIADPNEPGLRGDMKSRRSAKEVALNAEFDKAVNLIIDNKPEEGLKSLEKLKADNPKYKPEDMDKAIEGAKAMIADKTGAAAPAAK